MKRRCFMAGMGMGALTLADATGMTQAAYGAEIDGPKMWLSKSGHPSAKFPRVAIIGVGGAGCNLMVSMRIGGIFDGYGPRTELIAVDLCPFTLWYVGDANESAPERAPIKTIAIANFDSGRTVNAARAAALRHHDQLTGILNGADVVILVAGLGGGAGSAVTPIMAAWSRAAGARTVALAITPFDFGVSSRQSDNALNSLRSNADQVIHFSNQAVAVELGDGATLEEVFAIQQHRIATHLTSICLPPGHTSLAPGYGLVP